MINDDFNFTFDDSEFPVSIEEFAAYLDGNLSDDEMQRVSSVIENDEEMQGIMDSMEQLELPLADYGQEDMQLPEEIADGDFDVPETDNYSVGGGGFFYPFVEVAACASAPIAFDFLNDSFDEIEGNDFEKNSDLDENVCSPLTRNIDDSTNEKQISNDTNDTNNNISNDEGSE